MAGAMDTQFPASSPFWMWWRRASHLKPLLYVCILALSLGGVRPILTFIGSAPRAPVTFQMTVDADRIVAGVEAHPRLWDTRVWWTGPWAQGPEFPYYRPLSSLLWWAQYKVFGPNSRGAFLAIHLFWYALLLWVALGFWSELVGLRLAALGLGLWVTSFPTWLLSFASPTVALNLWIDDPEMTHGIAVVLALWCVLRACRADNPAQTRRYFVGAGAWFLVGVACKESAYVFPLMAPLILWHTGQLRKRWVTALLFVGMAALAYAYWTWALGGGGYRYDTNGAWLTRWWAECVGGTPGNTLLTDAVPLGMALLGMATFWAARKRPRTSVVCVLAALGALGWAATRQYDAPLSVVWRFFDTDFNGTYFKALHTALWLGLLLAFARKRPRAQVLAYGWVLLIYAPLLLRASTPHVLFFMSLGWGLWLAVPVRDLLRAGARLRLPARRAA